MEAGKNLIGEFSGDKEFSKKFSKIQFVPPGFINFYLSEEFLRLSLETIIKEGDKFGDSEAGKGTKINLEFVSANPTGPLTVGNARSASFGDTLGTGDFSVSDESDVLTFAQIVAGTGSVAWGVDGKGLDQTWYGETASDFVKFDQDGATNGALQFEDCPITMGDGTKILFGDALNTGDMYVECTTNVLTIGQVVAGTGDVRLGVNDAGVDFTLFGDTASQKAWWDASGDEWFFGADAEGVDVTFYGDIASSYMKWDENAGTNGELLLDAANIALGDGDKILFGDTLGTGDFSISDQTDVLTFGQIVADTGAIAIGVDGTGIDTTFYSNTAGDYSVWDEDAESLKFVGTNIELDNDSAIYDAVNAGTKAVSGTPILIEFRPTAIETLIYTVPTGYDLVITDAYGYKIAANGSSADDDIQLQNNDASAADIFTEEELNGVNDTVRFQFDGLIDTENEVEAGNTLDCVANEGASVDCIITVVGYLKTAD